MKQLWGVHPVYARPKSDVQLTFEAECDETGAGEGAEELDDIKKAYTLGASSYLVKPAATEALGEQLKVLHDYWMTCQVPMVDGTGRQLPTDSEGKLGERFTQI